MRIAALIIDHVDAQAARGRVVQSSVKVSNRRSAVVCINDFFFTALCSHGGFLPLIVDVLESPSRHRAIGL